MIKYLKIKTQTTTKTEGGKYKSWDIHLSLIKYVRKFFLHDVSRDLSMHSDFHILHLIVWMRGGFQFKMVLFLYPNYKNTHTHSM